MNISTRFAGFSRWVGKVAAHPVAFTLAVLVVAAWAVTGPVFGFSDTWQLAINTGTTIVTFLMVFLIQNTQNRDTAAMHLKLDELLRAVEGAHNTLIDLEDDTESEIEEVKAAYQEVAEKAKEGVREAVVTGTPSISIVLGNGGATPRVGPKAYGMYEVLEAAEIDPAWEEDEPSGADEDETGDITRAA